ncbi:putative tnpC protein [Mycobacterium xenopi 4042]|uniref:Putative tnpC protein n=1 Tax=Mycobacterium xenopi 4042 TaxID=1299334 RepID=X8BDU5_MYCXE|nr:putative tnpC protein [Mycobacterium xenopi 4042]
MPWPAGYPAPRPDQHPGRFAAPARKPMLHLPAHWHWRARWKALWHNVIGYPIAQPRAA